MRAVSRTEVVGISVCFLLAATIATAAPSIQVTHRQIATLEIYPMSATPAPEAEAPPYRIEVDPEHGGQTSFLLASSVRTSVVFSATFAASADVIAGTLSFCGVITILTLAVFTFTPSVMVYSKLSLKFFEPSCA